MRFKPGYKVPIPIVYLNQERSPGLKRGGFINYIHYDLECVAHTDKIPTVFEVDVDGMHVGDRISLDMLSVPQGLEPVLPPGALLSKIGGRRGLIPHKEPKVAAPPKEEEKEEEEEFDPWNDIF